MQHQRYHMEKEPGGTWRVLDVFTGRPVVEDEVVLVHLDIEEADDLVDLLNNRDIARRKTLGMD